jgi:hypothetical protein
MRGLNSSLSGSIAGVILVVTILGAAGGGCMLGPTNGETHSGSTIGQSITAWGYSNQPGVEVEIDVLNSVEDDPTVDTNWFPIGTATTSANGQPINDPTNLAYLWSLNVIPNDGTTPSRWLQGGLARIRAVTRRDAGVATLAAFDSDVWSCVVPKIEAGESWVVAGEECESPFAQDGRQPLIVSTDLAPADDNPSQPFLTMPTGVQTDGRPSASQQQATCAYYQSIQAPRTLNDFRSAYGFNEGETVATYYNQGDLGLGREMHCAKNGIGLACYVTNYGRDANGNPNFGGDPNVALAQAAAHQNPIATVAMVSFGPAVEAPDGIYFMVYANDPQAPTCPGTDLQPFAQLDSAGVNEAVPQNCMTCHAGKGSYDAINLKVRGAHFLPFDLGSFVLPPPADGGVPVEEAIRVFNYWVDSIGDPTPAMHDLIQGWYAQNPQAPNQPFDASYVPSGWANAAGSKVYTQVIKPYCRTCHVSQHSPTDWLTFSELRQDNAAQQYVCGFQVDGTTQHLMPQSQQTARRFWESPARAYFVNGLGLNDSCRP